MMNRLTHICILLFAGTALLSCVGKVEPPHIDDVLELHSDKSAVVLSQDDTVSFSVAYNGLDVTALADIYEVSTGEKHQLDGNQYIPQEEGVYMFAAEYDYLVSDTLCLTAAAPSPQKRPFFRKSLVFDFTATWCVNCPRMAYAIEDASKEHPNRVIEIGVHLLDEFSSEIGDYYVKKYSVSAIPLAVVDEDPATKTSVASSSLLAASIRQRMEIGIPVSGIKIESNANDGSLDVNIGCTIASAGDYRLSVLLLRDGVVAEQLGADSGYRHNSILIGHLQTDLSGDYLPDLKEGEVISRSYSLSGTDDLSNTRIVAFLSHALPDGSYTVHNAISCPSGSSIDYIYELN